MVSKLFKSNGVGESELDTHKMHKLVYSCIHIHFTYHVQNRSCINLSRIQQPLKEVQCNPQQTKIQGVFSGVEQLFSSVSTFRIWSLLALILKTSFFPNKVIDVLPLELWCQRNFCLVSLVDIFLHTFPCILFSPAKFHKLPKRVSYQQDSLKKDIPNNIIFNKSLWSSCLRWISLHKLAIFPMSLMDKSFVIDKIYRMFLSISPASLLCVYFLENLLCSPTNYFS